MFFFCLVQAHWRGYRFRKGVKEEQARRLAEVRAKMSEAAKNATEAKKLCNRTAFALEFLYKSKEQVLVYIVPLLFYRHHVKQVLTRQINFFYLDIQQNERDPSVVDPNSLNLYRYPVPEFWPNLDPDPVLPVC